MKTATGCNKQAYFTEKSARDALITFEKKFGMPYRYYACHKCIWWHLTTRVKPEKGKSE